MRPGCGLREAGGMFLGLALSVDLLGTYTMYYWQHSFICISTRGLYQCSLCFRTRVDIFGSVGRRGARNPGTQQRRPWTYNDVSTMERLHLVTEGPQALAGTDECMCIVDTPRCRRTVRGRAMVATWRRRE